MNLQREREILFRALGEPIGLLLSTSDPNRARQRLYQARKESAEPELAQLQIRMSPLAGGQLIIVKETISVPAEAEPEPSASDLSDLSGLDQL